MKTFGLLLLCLGLAVMAAVRADPLGRLLTVRAVPSTLADTTGPWAEPDWTALPSATPPTRRTR